ncbi:MAG: 50S ribosomal protein L18 [Candidatus Pacearchaeota archaeon]
MGKKGKGIVVKKRRRREGKTDYARRRKLLEGRKPRLVVRKTNRYIIAQIITSKEARDRVIVGLTSKALAKYGWTHSFKCLPACYLTGLLLGKMAREKGINEAILDIGLQRAIKGNRVFTVLFGASKFLSIPHGEECLPSLDRVYGKHIKGKELENEVKKIESMIMKSTE